MTFAELAENACRLANHLRSHGVVRGDRVLIIVENWTEAAIAFWGVLLADAVATPVNPLTKADKFRALIDDGTPTALIADAHLVDRFEVPTGQTTPPKIVLLTGGAPSPPCRA